jgi:hypothetical protein
MTDPEVRLHDVRVSGDVDRGVVLAAIERAVADASGAGAPTPEAVRTAVSGAVSAASSRAPAR